MLLSYHMHIRLQDVGLHYIHRLKALIATGGAGVQVACDWYVKMVTP